METKPSDIPLQCIVCPKQPTFSDVSHLLTHVSSKGHLSHYHELKILAPQDVNSQEILEAFDSWYLAYDIKSLISNRMQSKAKRKPRVRRNVNSDLRKYLQETPFENDHFKADTENMSFQCLTQLQPRRLRPHLHLWSTIRPRGYKAEAVEPFGFDLQSYEEFSLPKWSAMSYNDDTQSTKLKKADWEGMGIFDAATPEMKRKRNQKKETSAAIQLERHSLQVTPTEMIFTPSGSFRKTRYISGQPEFNSSPDRLTSPIAKPKRRRSNRVPLTNRDPNVLAESSNMFAGYSASENRAPDGKKIKIESDPESFDSGSLSTPGFSSNEMRHLTASLRLTPYSSLENRPPSTLLDLNTGTLYHSNFVQGAMPYYGYGFYG